MDYSLIIGTICIFIEKRLKTGMTHREMENEIGFSYRHIREIFKESTKVSLAKYISMRRAANAAFDIIHTDGSLTDIALEYGYEQYGSFIRAFKRVTGLSPSAFRDGRCRVGRRVLTAGIYAPAILVEGTHPLGSDMTEVLKMTNSALKSSGSCILLGVPKVEYKLSEATPFPACLKACLNYMGQDIDYAYLMAASGAAFRLRWNTGFWDGGNVDISFLYENYTEAFERAFKAAGRIYKLLRREDSSKEGFKAFIKREIDEGRPVIALGIIGPPEACIIAGYQQDGDVLLGWNFFQDRAEYARGITFYENGYFICGNWWENRDTAFLMSVGEEQGNPVADRELLQNALDILTKEKLSPGGSCIAGAQAAYDRWAEKISDDREFPKDMVMPLLMERIMCQSDAMCMVGEGRYYAAVFMDGVGERNPCVREECAKAAEYFRKASEAGFVKMNGIMGEHAQYESRARQFAEPETRRKLAELILEAKRHEASARVIVANIISKL